jgi:2-keto-4-pentenoate hydratase/2-oxohepta-3-ene-1,7-dioic acid hydratase in catechol pathway
MMMAGLIVAGCFAGAGAAVVDEPAADVVAKLRDALTLAQVTHNEQVHTLLVFGDRGDEVIGADLSAAYDLAEQNPMVLVARIGVDTIRQDVIDGKLQPQRYEESRLIVPRGIGGVQVAAGANYAEHGEEAGVDEVFLFPKASPPSHFNGNVATRTGELLDYEAEVCVRFDRNLSSMADFEAALKGFFLCADFTERATLMRHLDPDDVTSGAGFPEGKSGADRFPVGPFIVVPDHWQAWTKQAEIRLSVNGEERQRAVADEMILKIDQLVEKALREGRERVWSRDGEHLPLLVDSRIDVTQAVATGTPGGVVFREPGTGAIVWSLLKWIFTLSFIDNTLVNNVIEDYVMEAIEAGNFLQPGDIVEISGTGLGVMRITIVGE